MLRLYGPDELGPDGYPIMWHRGAIPVPMMGNETDAPPDPGVKHLIRELMGYRCERCGHPYPPGTAEVHPGGEWTPCDDRCTHGGPLRVRDAGLEDDWRLIESTGGAPAGDGLYDFGPENHPVRRYDVQAQWRILTVHHLNGVKWDCRWWNLAALCQRCHLRVQRVVVMDRVYPLEHSEWFKPHAAGWYASAYLEVDLDREQVLERLDELLALERQA